MHASQTTAHSRLSEDIARARPILEHDAERRAAVALELGSNVTIEQGGFHELLRFAGASGASDARRSGGVGWQARATPGADGGPDGERGGVANSCTATCYRIGSWDAGGDAAGRRGDRSSVARACWRSTRRYGLVMTAWRPRSRTSSGVICEPQPEAMMTGMVG